MKIVVFSSPHRMVENWFAWRTGRAIFGKIAAKPRLHDIQKPLLKIGAAARPAIRQRIATAAARMSFA